MLGSLRAVIFFTWMGWNGTNIMHAWIHGELNDLTLNVQMTTTFCWTHLKMTNFVCHSLQSIALSVGELQLDVVFQSIFGVRFITGHVKSGNQGRCSSVEQWCMPLSTICWGCSKLFMHSTSMNRQCFCSKFLLLPIICSRITAKKIPDVLHESLCI